MTAPGEEARLIGFLADTHSRKADGSDLPDHVERVFTGVDLIVHLGDVGMKGILRRLNDIAPVLVPAGANKGYVPHVGDPVPVKVLRTKTAAVGLWFNLVQPDKKITVGDEGIDFGTEPFDKLMKRRFGEAVDVVAFAGTHRPMELRHRGVLFFNPGSPTLPMDGSPASVAVLDVRATPTVELIHW